MTGLLSIGKKGCSYCTQGGARRQPCSPFKPAPPTRSPQPQGLPCGLSTSAAPGPTGDGQRLLKHGHTQMGPSLNHGSTFISLLVPPPPQMMLLFPQSRWETSMGRWSPTPWGAGRNPPNSRAGGTGGSFHTALVPARLTEQVDMPSQKVQPCPQSGRTRYREQPGVPCLPRRDTLMEQMGQPHQIIGMPTRIGNAFTDERNTQNMGGKICGER